MRAARTTTGAAAAMLALTLTACGVDVVGVTPDEPLPDPEVTPGDPAPGPDQPSPSNEPRSPLEPGPAVPSDGPPGGSSAGPGSAGPDDDGVVSIGVPAGWQDAEAASYLWAHVLEDEGYEVDLQPITDPTALFIALGLGEVDVVLGAWLPHVHGDHLDREGEGVVDLGPWYAEAPLTLAVNEDAPVTSLEELADHTDDFGNEIIGIEPGSGAVHTLEEDVVPAYGLEDMEVVTSSTAAMLAELETATEAGENIAVTLWRPHWAYSAFPIRDLEDPQGAFGEVNAIHTVVNAEMNDADPELVDRLENFEMSPDALASLMEAVYREAGTRPEDGVEDWVAEHPDEVAAITGG